MVKKLSLQFVIKEDIPNKNNRIYPKKVLQNIVDDFVNQKDIIGQIGMPKDGLHVDLSLTSHVVKNLQLIEGSLYADIEVLNTPSGNKLIESIDKGDVSFRLMGTGKVETVDGIATIQEGYNLIAINAVPTEDAS